MSRMPFLLTTARSQCVFLPHRVMCGLAKDSGEVKCFGDGEAVGPEPKGSHTMLAAGERHACAVKADSGEVVCWGEAAAVAAASPSPMVVGRSVSSLAVGDAITCVLWGNWKVSCWPPEDAAPPRPVAQQQCGLDPAVVASFPTMRYADAKALRVGNGKDVVLECAVCLSEFEDDEELRLLPSCSHAFHPACIGEWLAGHVTCPVCRCNLDPEDPAAVETAGSGEATEEGEAQQDQVAIDDVSHDGAEEEEERRRWEEATELERIGSQRRAMRSRSGRPAAPPVPRSHSTGHSLAPRLDGDLERFTLRLPEHVRREMVAAAGEESLRRTGPRVRERDARGNGGARSARLRRSDRWPSFITRTFSSRVLFWSASRRAPDLEAGPVAAGTTTGAAARARRDKTGGASDGGSVTPAKGSVRFNCLGGVGPAVTGARVSAVLAAIAAVVAVYCLRRRRSGVSQDPGRIHGAALQGPERDGGAVPAGGAPGRHR